MHNAQSVSNETKGLNHTNRFIFDVTLYCNSFPDARKSTFFQLILVNYEFTLSYNVSKYHSSLSHISYSQSMAGKTLKNVLISRV